MKDDANWCGVRNALRAGICWTYAFRSVVCIQHGIKEVLQVTKRWIGGGGGGGLAMVLVCLPLAAPIGLSPLHIPTLCGSERVLVVSTEPLDDLSCLTTPGLAVPEAGCCLCR